MTRVGLIVTFIGLIVTHIGAARLFRYQHVGIGNANPSRRGPDPTPSPNVSGFALQWNIGYKGT